MNLFDAFSMLSPGERASISREMVDVLAIIGYKKASIPLPDGSLLVAKRVRPWPGAPRVPASADVFFIDHVSGGVCHNVAAHAGPLFASYVLYAFINEVA